MTNLTLGDISMFMIYMKLIVTSLILYLSFWLVLSGKLLQGLMGTKVIEEDDLPTFRALIGTIVALFTIAVVTVCSILIVWSVNWQI